MVATWKTRMCTFVFFFFILAHVLDLNQFSHGITHVSGTIINIIILYVNHKLYYVHATACDSCIRTRMFPKMPTQRSRITESAKPENGKRNIIV